MPFNTLQNIGVKREESYGNDTVPCRKHVSKGELFMLNDIYQVSQGDRWL